MRRPFLAAALVFAWPAGAGAPPAPPDPELLEYLGETAGEDADFILFMESHEAERALERAEKEDSKEHDDE